MPAVLLAALPEAFICVALLLWLWATEQYWVPALSQLLQRLPVVGGFVASTVANAAGSVVAWAASRAKVGLDAIIQVIAVPVMWLQAAVGEVVTTAEAIVASIVALANQLGQLGAAFVANVVALAGQLLALASAVAHLAAAVPGIAADVARSLIAVAVRDLSAAIAAVRSALAVAVAAETALVERTRGDLVALVMGQAGLAASALATAVATLRQEWSGQLRPIEAELSGVKGITDAIAMAGIIPLALTTAAELTRITEECIRPGCDVIAPQLDTLQSLLSGVELVALAAVVAEAIHDPEAAARGTAAVADGIRRDVSGLTSAVLGFAL